ncbi:MAG: riboflavin synthase [Woeseiaceae bacterium]
MFTGIIKATGTIGAIQPQGGDVRLMVRSSGLEWSDFELGESIAVNGVCLTAVAIHSDGFDTDVSVETLDVTALGQLTVGSAVNLEPSISLGERLGGHLVSGHVDCTGVVKSRAADARSVRLEIEIPSEYGRYVARKGSVCVDGVSLTINEVSVNSFEVNIIPHTVEVTIIKTYAVGTVVNVEVDLLARYTERLLNPDGSGISLELLKAHGYA